MSQSRQLEISLMPVKTTQHYRAAQQAVSPPPSLSYAYTYNPVLEFAT